MLATRSVPDVAKRTGIPGKPTVRDEEQRSNALHAVEEAKGRAGSGAALARALGVSQPTVSAWLSGSSVPTEENRRDLARFLGWREVEILEGVAAAHEGGIRALETALDYHGPSHWSAHVVAKARKEAASGVKRTAKEWADRLDSLRVNEQKR